MFGIGFSEIVVILLVMIIFIRPEDLPKTLRSLGRLYGKLRLIYKEIMDSRAEIMKEIEKASTFDESNKDEE